MKKLLLLTTGLCAVVGLNVVPPINVAFAETGAWPTYTIQLTSGFDSFIKHDGMINEMARGEMLLGETDVVVAKHQVDMGLIEAPTKDSGLAAMTPVSYDVPSKLMIADTHLGVAVQPNAKKVVDLATVTMLSTDATPLSVHAKSDFEIMSMIAHSEIRPPMLIVTAGRSSTTALTMEVA